MKMPTIISGVEHEKGFITSGPDCIDAHISYGTFYQVEGHGSHFVKRSLLVALRMTKDSRFLPADTKTPNRHHNGHFLILWLKSVFILNNLLIFL